MTNDIITTASDRATRAFPFAIAGALLAATVAVAPARADDKADCDAGIEMITAEVAKDHPKAVADKLKTALRVAKREKGEQEYDECMDAVSDAKKALAK